MSKFVVAINVPGYLPTDDDPPTFDAAWEAWEFLADQRAEQEDFAVESDVPYSSVYDRLVALGTPLHWLHPDTDLWLALNGLAKDGTGTVYGDTPGYDGEHDLGLAYTVAPA